MINTSLYLWGFITGVAAVVCEVVFRKYNGVGYLTLLPYITIPAIVINYGIFKLMTYSSHFLEAFIVFSFSTATLRILCSNVILHEPVTIQLFIAYTFLVAAQIIKGV